MLKERGGPLCSMDCDPSSRSLSLKVFAQGTNEPSCRERSNLCCPGVMAVPGFSLLLKCPRKSKLTDKILVFFSNIVFDMVLSNHFEFVR